jgi:CRP/FNR family transcriptional regulator
LLFPARRSFWTDRLGAAGGDHPTTDAALLAEGRLHDNQAIRTFRDCAACALHHAGLCEALTPETRAALAKVARHRMVPEGTILTTEGAPSTEVHNIISGTVRLSKLLPDGREQIVGLIQPTDFLGCVFAKDCDFTATANEPVELCSFDKAAFERLLRDDPDLEHAFLREVLTELAAARDWMVILGAKTGLERVASFLLFVVERADRSGCAKAMKGVRRLYVLPLTRLAIGHFLGLTHETVSRQVSRLNAEGVIDLVDPRRFRVKDLERLREIAGSAVDADG